MSTKPQLLIDLVLSAVFIGSGTMSTMDKVEQVARIILVFVSIFSGIMLILVNWEKGTKQLKKFILKQRTMETLIKINRAGNDAETPGQLATGTFICKTLELPWLNNEVGKSCIPAGVYAWEKVGPSHIPYQHIAIKEVPGRSGICIHYGNYASAKKSDVLGCILTGSGYKDINGDGVTDIVDSKTTFYKLMSTLADSGTLIIE